MNTPEPEPRSKAGAPALLQQRLRQALALHRAGQLSQACRVYQEILGEQPQHYDALHLLGVIACQRH